MFVYCRQDNSLRASGVKLTQVEVDAVVERERATLKITAETAALKREGERATYNVGWKSQLKLQLLNVKVPRSVAALKGVDTEVLDITRAHRKLRWLSTFAQKDTRL